MPIVTLLTDFGTDDAYVGIVKGVIATRCPGAMVIDLTHAIAPGDVPSAADVLAGAWRYFPIGSVHCAVVDPGVGGGRRAIAAAAGGHRFVGPDNGLFTPVFDEASPSRIVSIESEAIFLKPVSATFHGRDVFAPAAAALCSGASLDELGPPIDNPVRIDVPRPERRSDGALAGRVVRVDRFGNLITNVPGGDVPRDARVGIADRQIAGLSSCYDSAARGGLLAIIGSGGRLEISVNRGSAAEALGVGAGAEVVVERGAVT